MTTETETIRRDRLARICQHGFETGLVDDSASEYCEPGYTDPDSGVILFANWNGEFDGDRERFGDRYADERKKTEQLGRIAEKLGAELEWSDEWSTCGGCQKAVRTSPDSYCWLASFKLVDDCELICRDCLLDDLETYVDDVLLNREGAADTFGIDLAALGFTRAEEGESGLHDGQNDTPADMLAKLSEFGDYVFQIDGTGQFDVSFSLWTRPTDLD